MAITTTAATASPSRSWFLPRPSFKPTGVGGSEARACRESTISLGATTPATVPLVVEPRSGHSPAGRTTPPTSVSITFAVLGEPLRRRARRRSRGGHDHVGHQQTHHNRG